MKQLSNYFTGLAQSKDRMLGIFFDAALPGAVVGLCTLSGNAALGVTGLLIIHGIIRDAVLFENHEPKKPTP